MKTLASASLLVALTACGPGVFSTAPPPQDLHVAAAANLAGLFDKLSAEVKKQTGISLIPSFGSTAQLTKQIESGAPFDLFLSADASHPRELAESGLADAPQEYARGKLAIWAPKRPDLKSISDLARPDVQHIAMANPDASPYGHAAMEALENSGLLSLVRPKIVFAPNINASKAFADTGNAEAALTAYSLVVGSIPSPVLVDPKLYKSISQSLCALRRTSDPGDVAKVIRFLLGPGGKAFFRNSGYDVP